MLPIITRRVVAGFACGMLSLLGAQAKNGAPHSLVVSPNYTDVTLTWSAPESDKTLKWHSGRDYNGDTAPSTDGQKLTKTYVAAKFDAADLRNYVGDKVEAITFFQYRPVFSATVMVYENGVVVSSAKADPAKYSKNTPLKVLLPEAVEIRSDSEYMFAVCFESGSNMDFVAIKDEASNASGKGDLMSSDGKKWVATGNGEYLITAHLTNDVDKAPQGYNVYRGADKLNSDLITNTSLSLSDEPAGNVSYVVSAVYDDGEYKSKPESANLISYASLLPSPASVSSSVSDLDVRLDWVSPRLGGNELTWSNKSPGISIGGTAATNTKVWIRNQFDASDLIAFRGGEISAINFQFSEEVVTGVTLFVAKDGVIDYYEAVAAEDIAGIKAGQWTKFRLSEPYKLEDGHGYSYGLYVLHNPEKHPISVDNSAGVDVKGNSFSVSSPNSKNFAASKPTWKTLKSGGMDGCWLMTADIQKSPAAIAPPVYDVYRDGQLVKSSISDLFYEETVADLGNYTYTVVSRSGDRVSIPAECTVNVKLPSAYAAPLIVNSTFDADTKQFEIEWNMDKEISHCGDAAYKIGFDEEITLMWGAQFSAAELAAYKGYSIRRLKFAIGDEIGDFSVGVYTPTGKALSKVDIPAGSVQPLVTYTIDLPEAVEVTGEQDLIFAYSGTIPAGKSAIILDEGHLVAGGARISLTGGLNWLNLSTLNPKYADYNVFISAMASENNDDVTPSGIADFGSLSLSASSVVGVDKVYGVEGNGQKQTKSIASRSSIPSVKGFNIYCNGKKVAETDVMEYKENIKRFASFTYYVTTVFANGWESAPSESISFTNRIVQKAVAPYGLTGERSGSDLVLRWQAPDKSSVMSYVPDGAEMKALRMTSSSSTITSYCVSKFPASDLSGNVGNVISHIQFGCGSTEISSASVIVMYGENIVYRQAVPVSTLIKGVNDVRLNEPVEIPDNTDVCVGFIMSYNSSTPHPLGCFECEDHTDFGDLISSSGTSGYWYSLHTKFKSNYCWYVKAVLATADEVLSAKGVSLDGLKDSSYNIYRDGVLIDNVTGTTATVKNAGEGKYYVTAVNGDDESGESNAVIFGSVSGIDDVESDGFKVIYDRASCMIETGTDANIEVFSMSGSLVASSYGSSLSVAELASGVYTIKVSTDNETIVEKIVK